MLVIGSKSCREKSVPGNALIKPLQKLPVHSIFESISTVIRAVFASYERKKFIGLDLTQSIMANSFC